MYILCFQSASLAGLFTIATGLFPGLTGQTYKQDGFCSLLSWTWEAKPEIVRFSRAAVNLHMHWELFIICASRPVCLPIQALLGILIWLTVPSHLSCPCFRQMLLYLYLYLTAEFRLQLQCENLLCLRWCWKFMSWWNPCFRSSSDNNGKFLPLLIVKAS